MKEEEISFRFRSGHGRRYDVFEEFAAGGVATLHLARFDSGSGVTKVVAVKKLHRHLSGDPGLRSALLDEARVIARIQHPNVVSVLDVCEDGEDLFIAMEYVHGVSLARLLKATEPSPLDPSIACAIVADALKGLHAAHEASAPDGRRLELVHRDVSPQNIIVGADGVTRVIDFGLAYALGRVSSTQSGVVKGKPSYMSPEQVRGERVTRASDIFSAGSVLWGALTGCKLFDGDVIEATMTQVMLGLVRKPTEIVPEISPALEEATMRALARSPAARFETAIQMARALEKACPPPLVGTVGEWVERVGADYLAEMSARVRHVEASALRLGSERTIELLEPDEPKHDTAEDGDQLAAKADSASDSASTSEGRPRSLRRLGTVGLVIAAALIGWFAASLRAASRSPAVDADDRDAAPRDERAMAEPAPPSSVDPPELVNGLASSARLPAHVPGARPVTRHPTRPPNTGAARPPKPCNDMLDPKCK